ncbi:MAG: hypothetical protein ACJZ33_02785, partial [Candidatus Poseidoniales archaeon]
MKIQKVDITPEKILDLLRDNFVFIIVAGIFTYLLDYNEIFEGPDKTYYTIISGLALLLALIIIKKYRNPFYYSPNYIFFVKDRSDPMVKLEPLLDPIITTLGLVRFDDFVNVRYRLYPDLPTGIELNPNTGLISGFPMEVGNHTSEVKMRFLGGEYSTSIRIEVVNTLKEKMVVPERDEFAPPRKVSQLLLREEDVLKREQDLEYSLAREREAFEKEFHIKELSLKSNFDSEKSKLSKELAKKGLELTSLSSEMEEKLEKVNQEKMDEIAKAEAEMVEVLQDKERDFIESEREIKQKVEDQKRELEENRVLMKEFGITTQKEEPEEEVVEEPVEEVVEEELVEEEPEEEVVEEELVEEEPEEEVVEEELVEEEPEEEIVEEELVEEEPEEEIVEEEPEEEPEEEEQVEEETEEEYDYVSMTKAELIELAEKRNLPISGAK